MKRSNSTKKDWSGTLHSVLWIATLILGTLIILAVTIELAGKDPVSALSDFFTGAFGSRIKLAATAARSVILILYALGITLSFRAGLINIGAEGQARVGGAAAAALGTKAAAILLPVPFLGMIVILFGGALAGALWSCIAGVLRLWRGVSEVVVTLMLNFTGLLLVEYLVSHREWLQGAGTNYLRAPMPQELQFSGWGGTEFHAGIFLAIPAVLLIHIFLFHTRTGLNLRAMGLNPNAARACGVRTERVGLLTFLISGALAGTAGALGILALGALEFQPTYPDYGYTAIAVALVADLKPLRVLPAGILFAALEVGAQSMESSSGVPHWVVFVVQGLIVLAILARGSGLFKPRAVTSASEASA